MRARARASTCPLICFERPEKFTFEPTSHSRVLRAACSPAARWCLWEGLQDIPTYSTPLLQSCILHAVLQTRFAPFSSPACATCSSLLLQPREGHYSPRALWLCRGLHFCPLHEERSTLVTLSLILLAEWPALCPASTLKFSSWLLSSQSNLLDSFAPFQEPSPGHLFCT